MNNDIMLGIIFCIGGIWLGIGSIYLLNKDKKDIFWFGALIFSILFLINGLRLGGIL